MRDYPHIPAKPIGELIAPIVSTALHMVRLQRSLNCIEDPTTRKILVMSWWERGEITPEQAELLIIENGLGAA